MIYSLPSCKFYSCVSPLTPGEFLFPASAREAAEPFAVICEKAKEHTVGSSSGPGVIPLEISQGCVTWPPWSLCLLNATLQFLAQQWDTATPETSWRAKSQHRQERERGEAWALCQATKCLMV